MSSPSAADEAVIARVREAMTAAREAEYALLVALGELAESGPWEGTGHRRPARLLEELCRVDPAPAARLVTHAEHVLATVTLTGREVPPRLSRAAAIAADGVIGEEHLRVLVRARQRLERIPGIEPHQVAEADELLAEAARSLSPCGLERVVDRLLDTLDSDGAAPEEEPEPIDELLVTRRRDGTPRVRRPRAREGRRRADARDPRRPPRPRWSRRPAHPGPTSAPRPCWTCAGTPVVPAGSPTSPRPTMPVLTIRSQTSRRMIPSRARSPTSTGATRTTRTPTAPTATAGCARSPTSRGTVPGRLDRTPNHLRRRSVRRPRRREQGGTELCCRSRPAPRSP